MKEKIIIGVAILIVVLVIIAGSPRKIKADVCSIDQLVMIEIDSYTIYKDRVKFNLVNNEQYETLYINKSTDYYCWIKE